MNRYTYKAKRKDNQEWVYGYYIKHLPYTPQPLVRDIEKAEKELEQDYEHYIMYDGFSDWGMPRNTEHKEITPETLCQCTGLQDIEGNYIFENDIVLGACIEIVGKDYIPNKEHEVIEVKGKLKTIKWWEKYIVIWNEKESGFKFKNLETNIESVHIECEHKIIGNKFDEVKE